ncbi:hypothetical protein QL093DRAFT_2262106 [Fusarium oxysporum]|nr:hypothetical protein QL093DRAFT_2262106 [Fusarium oxysporum]
MENAELFCMQSRVSLIPDPNSTSVFLQICSTLFLRMPSLNSYLATAFPQIYPSVKISAPPQAPANKVKSLQIKIWRILSPGLAGPHEYRVSET